ncbi:hypothetical protein FE257_011401 [Aspergillus nanangensis]|uniref:Uncharacterized protein n=1 Tax=Aspergillus nanangensis TaxID=2582783 RepID=A0AAD4CHC1_ASPNN|nr:hypothetical protein FE257_011401 [Aspergillus nanangensis]
MTAVELDLIETQEEKVQFETFETSAAIIQRAGWRLLSPQTRRITDEEECHAIIQHKRLLQTAEDSGWTSNGFTSLVEKGTTGSATFSGAGKINLFLQTPRDSMPFIAFSITELPAEARKHGSDWVCLLFLTHEIALQSLLREPSFPSDYSPLFPDFMYIAVRILENQLELVREGLRGPTAALVREEEGILQMKPDDFGRARRALFDIEKRVRELRDRWRFVQDLAECLTRCFGEIVSVSGGGQKEKGGCYSRMLSQRVGTQVAIAAMLELEFESIPAAIEEQHRKIAHNSFVSAEEARRDGSSMKTIAAITLIFLPATTVASIFSMSMFNWGATADQPIASHRLWIYFVVAVGLTALVLASWLLWFMRHRQQNNTRDLPWRYIDPAISGAREMT